MASQSDAIQVHLTTFFNANAGECAAPEFVHAVRGHACTKFVFKNFTGVNATRLQEELDDKYPGRGFVNLTYSEYAGTELTVDVFDQRKRGTVRERMWKRPRLWLEAFLIICLLLSLHQYLCVWVPGGLSSLASVRLDSFLRSSSSSGGAGATDKVTVTHPNGTVSVEEVPRSYIDQRREQLRKTHARAEFEKQALAEAQKTGDVAN